MRPVGYLLNLPEGLEGERGLYYNYILASNGLFIEAENKFIFARIAVGDLEVRGLAPMESCLQLLYGSIPQRFFDLALDYFLADVTHEHYVAVTAGAGYQFYCPVQDREGGRVVYEMGDDVVLDIHSHGRIGAFFSPQDDRDEKGLKIYGVVGEVDKTPIVKLRLGVYGYFHQLNWREIFDGQLNGARENEREEGLQNEIPGFFEELAIEPQHNSGWLRWNRLFRR